MALLDVVNKDFRDCNPPKPARLIFTDPPYNIGHDYGPVSDKQTPEDYLEMMSEFALWAAAHTRKNAHLVVLHYPEFFFRHGARVFLSEGWEYRQQIRWCYRSNIGQSKRKFTTASRELLWLTKGDPFVNSKADPEPYQNPTDRRVKALIDAGSPGRAPYDWWTIELQKNVGKDYVGYSNQIPRSVIHRVISSLTKPGAVVVDPFAGTGSTLSVALELSRQAWGCDANPEAPCFR